MRFNKLAPIILVCTIGLTHYYRRRQQRNNDNDNDERDDSSTTHDVENTLSHDGLREFNEKYRELLIEFINSKGEKIDMGRPRESAYNNYFHGSSPGSTESIRLGEDKPRIIVTELKTSSSPSSPPLQVPQGSHHPASCVEIDTELRGITMNQLEALYACASRLCREENWTRNVYENGKDTGRTEDITPETMNLYDIVNHVVIPFTQYSGKSFVETLPSTAGTQPPRFFVSHFWGEPFPNTLDCLRTLIHDFSQNYEAEHDARGGGMTMDTPFWICAFANNQHNLGAEIPEDPSETGFAKAMRVAEYRTASILDKKATIMTRLWCGYEKYLTLILPLEEMERYRRLTSNANAAEEPPPKGLWAVYTPLQNMGELTAVGIAQGGAPGEDKFYTALREQHFPIGRIILALNVVIQTAQASRPEDITRILNAIVGRRGNAINLPKLDNHPMYDSLNHAIRGALASTTPAIVGSYNYNKKCRNTVLMAMKNCVIKILSFILQNDYNKKCWNTVLVAMKNGVTKTLSFNLHPRGPFGQNGCNMTTSDAAKMISHLPAGLEELKIESCPYGELFFDALFDWMENESTQLRSLEIYYTCIGGSLGGKECGERLAKILANKDDCKIDHLALRSTDLVGSRNAAVWMECLERNQSLVVKFQVIDMAFHANKVEETESNIDIDLRSFLNDVYTGNIFWDGNTFPDATMTREQAHRLTLASKAADTGVWRNNPAE